MRAIKTCTLGVHNGYLQLLMSPEFCRVCGWSVGQTLTSADWDGTLSRVDIWTGPGNHITALNKSRTLGYRCGLLRGADHGLCIASAAVETEVLLGMLIVTVPPALRRLLRDACGERVALLASHAEPIDGSTETARSAWRPSVHQRGRRRCLGGCGREFVSEWAGNRICPACREQAVTLSPQYVGVG